MKRRLNVRLLAGLLVAAIGLSYAIHSLHHFQIKKNSRVLLELAERAKKKGELAKAEEYFQLYLGFERNDSNAVADYALVLAARAKSRDDQIRALKALEQSLQRSPDRVDIRGRVVDLAFALGLYSTAQRNLSILLGRPEPSERETVQRLAPGDGYLEDLMGQCAERLQDYAAAVLWYKNAISHAPEKIDTYVRLAELLRNRMGDVSGSDRVMDARETKSGLISANSRSSRAYLERARYRKRHNIERADDDVARALEIAPTQADVLLTAAGFAIERGDYVLALRHLTVGLEHNPGDWRLVDAIASNYRTSGKLKEAEKCLRRGIAATTHSGGQSRLTWMLADTQIDESKYEDARVEIERLRKKRALPELLTYLEARIKVGEGKWFEAATDLEAIYPLLADKSSLAYTSDLLLGQCYEQLGDIDRRFQAYRRAVTLDPRENAGRLGLATTLAEMGRLDEAIALYRNLIGGAASAGPSLARLLILRNLRQPRSLRDWREVEQILNQASRVALAPVEIIVLRAEALVAQDHPDRARDLLTTARDQQPGQVELWIALSQLADQQERPQTALTLLGEAEKRLGDRVEVRLARAIHWARQNGEEALEALNKLERDPPTFSAIDQERFIRGLTDAHLKIGDRAGAKRLLRELVRLRPMDLILRYSEFELSLQAGDGTAMETALERMRSLQSPRQTPEQERNALWHYAHARFLIWSASRKPPGPSRNEDLENARLSLARAAKQRPSWSLVPLAQAQIDEVLGNPERALKGYLQGIELGQDEPEVLRRAVQLLFDLKRYNQADELMRRIQERGIGAKGPELPRLAAEISLQLSDRARALEFARKATPVDSKNYRDHLWFGQILWAAGETAKAEPELRTALQLSRGAPEALITLIQYLARTGRKDQAQTALKQANEQLNGKPAPLTFAQCYLELGELDHARAQFRAARSRDPDDIAALRSEALFALGTGEVDRAEADLRQILDLNDRAPDDAAWARRQLATLLATSGNRRKSREALKLLGIVNEGASFLPSADEPVDDIRAKAKVLSLRNNRDARRAAIRGLQQLIDRDVATLDDQYLLFQFYQADANLFSGERLLKSLLARYGEQPLLMAQKALLLLRQGAIDEAQTWLEKLEKAEPRSLRTVEVKARILAAKGRAIEAVPPLRAAGEENASQLGYVAGLLEELGQFGPAEELLRKFAAQPRRPLANLALAKYLGRRDRVPEAIDLCEKSWDSTSPEAVAEVIVSILYSSPVNAAKCQRAGMSLENALTKSPGNAGLLFQLGNARSLEGRYEEAEALYRESRARDESNSGPLANLAWLLARRDGKGPEALELIAGAIELDGPTPNLLDTRAIAYLATGRSDLAIKDMEDAVAVSPSSLKWVHLAQAYWAANRKTEATSALERAKRAGLRTENFTPLEKNACRGLLDELAQR